MILKIILTVVTLLFFSLALILGGYFYDCHVLKNKTEACGWKEINISLPLNQSLNLHNTTNLMNLMNKGGENNVAKE